MTNPCSNEGFGQFRMINDAGRSGHMTDVGHIGTSVIHDVSQNFSGF